MSSRCSSCGGPVAGSGRCPACGAPTGAGSLAREGAFDQSLVREMTRGLLVREEESLGALVRLIDDDLAGPLAPSELEAALDRVHDEGPSLPEMEALLAPAGSTAMLEGVKLSELLDGGDETKAILKKGLIFLKRKMVPTALEWWRLNRQKLDDSKARLELLLLMMEAFTLDTSGQDASKTLQEIRGHPLYKKYKK